MAFCPKCGTPVPPQAQFCQKCGQPQPATPYQQPLAQPGLTENAAACLSYALGWITGIIFYLIDRRPYVRFHAAQSIVTFGGLHIIRMILGGVFGFGWFFGGFRHHPTGFPFIWGPGIALIALISFIGFVLWIVCMVKAYQGERFMVPIAGDIAVNLANQ